MRMSAIAGILDLPAGEEIVKKLLLTMKRRGPDGEGSYTYKGYTLLHTKLSTSKHRIESNPYILDWGAERYVIAFDGALYNAPELRSKLEKLGHHFDGLSDDEVVLHAYVQWGEGALLSFNGVFAFSILQERAGIVFIARDRIGVKPLFYMHHNDGLLLSSEIKTILSYPDVPARLDANGAGELLLLGPGRTPGSGVFRDIYEIEPGCFGVYHDRKLQITRYWKLTDREHTESFEETAEHIGYLLQDAVHRQMMCDVPLGTMLSGGLDSSLISALCARELDAQGKSLETFSVDYLNQQEHFQPNRFQPNSDTEYIRIMLSELDSRHHWTVLSPEDLVNLIADATIARDLPGMGDVDCSLLAFCEQIKPHAGVVLSGECADEIFGGYPWYRDEDMRNVNTFPWCRSTPQRATLLHPWLKDALNSEEFVRERYEAALADSDILPDHSAIDRRIKQLVNLNFRYFMQTLLDRGDRMSMYHGLEIRMPFCDYRIAEYLYGVPWEFKDYRGREKGLLRYASEGLLPQSVLYRKKSPYPKIFDPKFSEIVSNMLQAVLHDQSAPLFDLVNREAVGALMQDDFVWPWYGQLMRKPQTIAYLLQLNYWLEHYNVQLCD